jgi:glyoxylase-like metal-dependent hydrolase (beta-lactamase superfamily II)
MLAGSGGWLEPARLVAHCLLIEAPDGLVLVDTGFGGGDVADPRRLRAPFRATVRPELRENETALRQVETLGLDPNDVRDIVVTHLDLDHAGGLGDFPSARVHVFAPELATAQHPPVRERLRYVPAQWAHGPDWNRHDVAGDAWFGFESVRVLGDLDSEVVMVPLQGHTAGHTGIAVKQGEGWLLHCGDAYFHHDEVATPPSCPPGLKLFQAINAHDNTARGHNQERLGALAREHGAEVELICSHDADLFDRSAAVT